MVEMLFSLVLLHIIFPSPCSAIPCWVDIGHGGNIYTKEIGKHYNPGHTYPLLFLENRWLLNIYNLALRGMPRNEEEINTAHFCVIGSVIFIIFNHSE